MKELKDDIKAQIGSELGEMLFLQLDGSGNFKTTWGPKTSIGLYEMVKTFLGNWEKLAPRVKLNLSRGFLNAKKGE